VAYSSAIQRQQPTASALVFLTNPQSDRQFLTTFACSVEVCCCASTQKSGKSMGAAPKPRIKLAPKPKDREESGLWVDAVLIAKIHGQRPTSSLHPTGAANAPNRFLHFADLALGTIKADKFRSKKVSKTRE
jgi:hypothetical protein